MARRGLPLLLLLGALLAAWRWAGTSARAGDAPPADAPPPEPAAEIAGLVRPFLARHCEACHGGGAPEAGLDLTSFPTDLARLPDAARLLEVRRRVVGGEMPPAGSERPSAPEQARFLAWVDRALVRAHVLIEADPGRVTVRRLSRFEYGRTVKHLLDLDFEPGASFPADDLGYGFDNVGDVLTMSPLLLEKYADAAAEIARRAISTEDPTNPTVRRLEAEGMTSSLGPESVRGDGVGLFSNGSVTGSVTLPRDGEYLLRARVVGQQAGPDPVRAAFLLDGRRIETLDVAEPAPQAVTKELRRTLAQGRHEVGVAFVNDYYRPDSPDPAQRDRNLLVDWVEVVGPVDARPLPPSHVRLFAKDPQPKDGRSRATGKDAARMRATPIVRDLLPRAWRRPVTGEEVRRLADLVQAGVDGGRSFEEALGLALQAALVSPHFLFRLEPGAATGPDGAPRDLDGHALAVRLSYFLWSSLPDAELTKAAAAGRLAKEAGLLAEARRMLADPKAEALATNFAVQWLELRNLESATPDAARFPGFEALRDPLRREAELFFDAVRREGRDVGELLGADFTFVNGPLAAHYGIPGVDGPELRRVAVADGRRGGVLTQGGVLTVTSNPTRTSPVKRGKWLLENVLDAPPRAPPPGADSLDEAVVTVSAASLRERLEQHRAKPECAACHARLDPLGFALERFDAVGRWREQDGGQPVDATGTLPDGRRLDDLAALRAALLEDRAFVRCLVRKLFTFALGRAPTPRDELALFALVESLPEGRVSIDDLVLAVVRTDAFRKRRPGA